MDVQRRRVGLVGLKGKLSKEVIDGDLCRQGPMDVPGIRSCQRRQTPELQHRTTWCRLVEWPRVATVNGGQVSLVVVALEIDIRDAAVEEVGHVGDLWLWV